MRCAVAPLKASSASAHRALSGCSTRASCARDARRASAPAADTPSSGNAAPGAHLLVARFHFSGHGAQRQPQHRMRSGASGALRQHIARKVRHIVGSHDRTPPPNRPAQAGRCRMAWPARPAQVRSQLAMQRRKGAERVCGRFGVERAPRATPSASFIQRTPPGPVRSRRRDKGAHPAVDAARCGARSPLPQRARARSSAPAGDG